MKRFALYWFTTSCFMACLYLGTVKGVEGAANVALLYVWFSSVCALFVFSDDVVRSYQKRGPPPAPAWVDVPIDIVAIMLMAWHGWVWSATAYTLHVLLAQRLRVPLPEKPTAKDAI